MTQQITEEEVLGNVGLFIRFEGHGILDGLRCKKCKIGFYKIIGIDPGNNRYSKSIILQQYRARKKRFLPIEKWDQGFEIIGKDEFDTLPIY